MTLEYEPDRVRECVAAIIEFLRGREPHWRDHEMMLATVIVAADIGGCHAANGCCDPREMFSALEQQLILSFLQTLTARPEGSTH